MCARKYGRPLPGLEVTVLWSQINTKQWQEQCPPPHPLSGLKVDHKCSSAHPFNVLPIITTQSSFPYARQQPCATKTLKVNKLCRYNM
jgi:hypothetical protein